MGNNFTSVAVQAMQPAQLAGQRRRPERLAQLGRVISPFELNFSNRAAKEGGPVFCCAFSAVPKDLAGETKGMLALVLKRKFCYNICENFSESGRFPRDGPAVPNEGGIPHEEAVPGGSDDPVSAADAAAHGGIGQRKL